MRSWLRNATRPARRYFEPRAVVLMYHRVTEPEADIWDLAVSPVHFEQQLQVLQQMGTVLPAHELAARLHNHTLPRRSIAITFDDGYRDNYLQAKPLLEKYALPATFFIASGNVGQAQEFWWDELAGILLLSERLPAAFSLALGPRRLEASLEPEQLLTPALRQQHAHWKAEHEPPPSRRAALFYQLWEYCKPLEYREQQLLLQQLRAWAGWPIGARPAYQSVLPGQLRELGQSSLFTIGAHTVTHPALACHPPARQEQELLDNKQALAQALGCSIDLLAYPYGNHSNETTRIAARLGFAAAFTTAASVVTPKTAQHRIGRFVVSNWSGVEFRLRLDQWFNS